MEIRLVIQLLFIGLMWGYVAYKEDNWIKTEDDHAPILFWLAMWLLFPLAFMWYMFLDALEKKDKSDF